MKFLEWNKLLKTTLLTLILSCIGFALLELNLVPYGFILFCVMPVVIGYILGQYPSLKISLFFGAILGVVCFFYLLYIGGLESIFCIVTLSPFLLFLLFVGIYIGYLIRKKVDKTNENKNQSSSIYILPIVILFASSAIEKFFTEKYTEVTVESKITLPHPKEKVFDYVKSFDTLISEKPFLFLSLRLS